MSRTIELFGLPSAGKTTVAQSWSNQRQLPIVSFHQRLSDYRLVGWWIITHPLKFCRLYQLLKKETPNNTVLFKHKRRIFLAALVKEAKAQSLGNRGAIIDDGLLQFLLGLYERRVTEPEAKQLISYFLNGRQVIMVEASTNVRNQRLRDRGRIPRLFLGREYLERWQPILEHNYQLLKSVLLSGYRATVYHNE